MTLYAASHDELIVLARVQTQRIVEQDARIVEQVRQNEDLTARLARVEHLLSRNSQNSSNPPSKDFAVMVSRCRPHARGGDPGHRVTQPLAALTSPRT